MSLWVKSWSVTIRMKAAQGMCIYDSGQLPTHPSRNLKLTPTSHLCKMLA